MYYVKLRNGEVKAESLDCQAILGWYYWIRDKWGYAELWYKNEMILSSR